VEENCSKFALVVKAWFRIAGLPIPDGFPTVSVSGSPSVVLRSTLLQADPTPWMECHYPHWKGEWSVVPSATEAEIAVTTTYTVENAAGWKELGIGIWYPPSSGEIRLSGVANSACEASVRAVKRLVNSSPRGPSPVTERVTRLLASWHDGDMRQAAADAGPR
jgi:hypothetical protein